MRRLSPSGRRRLVNLIGVVAMAVSIVVLGRTVGGQISEGIAGGWGWTELWRLLLALPITVVGLGLVHLAWGLLAAADNPRTAVRAAAVSGRAQVGKYLPGNVAHLAGRQLLLARLGWSQQSGVAASLLEVLGLAFTAGLIMIVGAIAGVRAGISWSSTTVVIVVAGGCVLAVGTVVVARVARFEMLRRTIRASRRLLSRVAAMYLCFHLLGGLAMSLLLPDVSRFDVVVASVAAWVAGFLAPGVPAGVGVREAVFVVAIGSDAGALAGPVLGYRVVTVVADLLAFAVGWWTERSYARAASDAATV